MQQKLSDKAFVNTIIKYIKNSIYASEEPSARR